MAKRGRPVGDIPDELIQGTTITQHPKKKRAPKGTFDRTAYQRELMRKRRAAEREKK